MMCGKDCLPEHQQFWRHTDSSDMHGFVTRKAAGMGLTQGFAGLLDNHLVVAERHQDELLDSSEDPQLSCLQNIADLAESTCEAHREHINLSFS